MSLVMSVEEIVEEIIEAALKLDPKTRWRVVEKIAASLEEDRILVEDAEALWLEEAARRARELREGKADEIPGDEVMARARALLG
jgi:Putative addiction module component